MSTLPPLPDDFPEQLRPFVAEVDRHQQIFDAKWPELMELRRRYAVDPTPERKEEMLAVVQAAEAARADLDAALATLSRMAGVDLADLEEQREPIGDPFPRLSRHSIMEAASQPTGYVEDYLAAALDLIQQHAPRGWLGRESPDIFRLSTTRDDEPISIVKGVRLESERPKGHRLRQAITLARDFLEKNVRYDHFGGAGAVTQLAQLGRKREALLAVGGAPRRIDALFGAADTDSVMFELLVASACAAKGREMVFVKPNHRRSPDLRCLDAFKMVVECKRSGALTTYEKREEARMRDLFRRVRKEALARGQHGAIELSFSMELDRLDLDEVAATCVRQRLAAHPENPLSYRWGTVSYRPSAFCVGLSEPTKNYSPRLIEEVFDWDLASGEWDGLIVKVDGPVAAVVDQVRSPLGIAWRVEVEAAVIKRSRAPMELFAKALTQIPKGEFGVIYLAYHEGARAEMADNRTEAFIERIQQWEHDAGIHVPATFLVRQFSIPRGHGDPDMIENSVRFSGAGGVGADWVFRDYPGNVFTTP